MTTTASKRTLEEANIDSSNPSKKRKLNEDESISITTNNNVNNNSNDDDKKNDNTAKSNDDKNDKKDPNSDVSNWTFKASDFTFGNNSWVKQTSNASDLSNDESTSNKSPNTNKSKVINDNTIDSFSEFAGLGFKKVLDDQNSKDPNSNDVNGKAENDDDNTDKDKDKDKDTDKDNKESDKDKTKDKKEKDAWGGAWSNSNPDGTFKLAFDWGSWENSNTKIDLNTSSKVGWESQAPKFDPNTFEQDDKTKKVLDQMVGEQDTGDSNDDNKCAIHCKIYNLESGKYIERGKGIVKVNTYSIKEDGDDKDKNVVKGRILCRRDQILTTIINAQILKEMKFEKVGNFVRFAVVQQKEKGDDENENEDKNKNKNESKENDENKDKNEEDNDMETEIKTFLMKPINKSQIETLLSSIKSVQELLV